MSTTPIHETRSGELPIPYSDSPVGILIYEGHEVEVWSIATTTDGKVIYLNCSATDAAISATLKRLLRKSGGKATFQPAHGLTWIGPTELSTLSDRYETITQALTHNGLRLKNQCLLPDSLNIAVGLSRPMEEVSTRPVLSSETEDGEYAENQSDPEIVNRPPDASAFRYLIGDVTADRPPAGTLFAHLKSLVVVCHPQWEIPLWEHGKKLALILPQPALGIRAWSMTRERAHWTNLIRELWMNGTLSRPGPTELPFRRTKRAHFKK